jgi:GT2 family glycosyltransferase
MTTSRTFVITVNFKGAHDTALCLASLEKSTVPVKAIVVDNTPNDPDLEEALAPFADVRLISASHNLGFGQGNNLGIEWAVRQPDCEFILILNNDATIKPDTIERMVAAMKANPEAVIITPRIVLAENESILSFGGGEVSWKRGSAIIPGIHGPSDSKLAMTSREVGFATGCAMLMRKEILQALGGFDPLFFMYEEDLDLSLRAKRLGLIFYTCDALVCHTVRGSSREIGQPLLSKWSATNPSYGFHTYHMTRGSVINARRHAKGKAWAQWVLFFPLFLLGKVLRASLELRLDALRPVISGIYDGIKIKLK